jgi:hypothetical protein
MAELIAVSLQYFYDDPALKGHLTNDFSSGGHEGI